MHSSRSPWVLRDSTILLALVPLGVWVVWGHVDGGFSPSAFGVLGVLVIATAAVALALPRPVLTPARRAALLCLVALSTWTALSILWASFRGEAVLGSAKMVLYAAALAVFVARPWSRDARTAVLAAHVFGVGLVGVLALLELTRAGAPLDHLTDGRATGPVGYVNGSVALWMSAFWPAAWLAGVRGLPVIVRAGAGGTASLLVTLSVLGQSRGWLYLLPLGVGLFLLLARQRLRALGVLALVGAAAGVAYPVLADVSERASLGLPVAGAIDRAGAAGAAAAAAVALAVALWAVIDRRVALARRTHQVVAAGVAVLLGAAAVAGGTAAVVTVDDPRAWASGRWDDFTSGDFPEGDVRFGGALGTNRTTEWRIAWELFREHPVAGAGADNYAAAYLRARPNDDYHPRYPHSTPLRLLSQLGVVGFVLFAAAVIVLAGIALRQRRSLDVVAGGAVGAALTVFGYWLLHGSIDWFWEIPALALPAFALLGLAAAPAPDAAAEATGPPSRRRLAAAGGLPVLLAIPLVALWLADSYVDTAVAAWRQQPEQSLRWLDRAARLDRLSAEPLVVEGGIALRLDDRARARAAFREAVAREPENWYAHFQLALLAAGNGEWRAAQARLATARSLNPREPVLAQAALQLEQRIAPDPLELNRRLLDEP